MNIMILILIQVTVRIKIYPVNQDVRMSLGQAYCRFQLLLFQILIFVFQYIKYVKSKLCFHGKTQKYMYLVIHFGNKMFLKSAHSSETFDLDRTVYPLKNL